jgi:hypothetical protein
LESILELKSVKDLIDKSIESVSNKIDEKLKFSQQESNCDQNVYCGLGCQLHGFSSGLLCATEKTRHFSVINYFDDQYENYFGFFKLVCNIDDEINKAGKLGMNF